MRLCRGWSQRVFAILDAVFFFFFSKELTLDLGGANHFCQNLQLSANQCCHKSQESLTSFPNNAFLEVFFLCLFFTANALAS